MECCGDSAGSAVRAIGSESVMNYNRQHLRDVSCLHTKDEKSCERVKELHLSFNYITEVPAETLALYALLTHLSLACNSLASVPPSLQLCCPHLKHLHLANNRITTIEHLEQLHDLECLDLRCNRISCLDNLLTLVGLNELCLSGNVIESAHWANIPSFPSLHSLGLYANKLTDFGGILHHLSRRASGLRCLTIGCNPLSGETQLTLQSAILTTGHVNYYRARELYDTLGQIFLAASQEEGSEGDSVELESVMAAVESACKKYAGGQDWKRIVEVAKVLLLLKLNFPRLESVDDTRLPT